MKEYYWVRSYSTNSTGIIKVSSRTYANDILRLDGECVSYNKDNDKYHYYNDIWVTSDYIEGDATEHDWIAWLMLNQMGV